MTLALYVLYAALIALLFAVVPWSKATKRPWSIWGILTGFMVLFSIYATEHEGDISYLVAGVFLTFIISFMYAVVGIGSDRVRWGRMLKRYRDSRDKWMEVGRFCRKTYEDNKQALKSRMKISIAFKSMLLKWRGHAKKWKKRAINYRTRSRHYKSKADMWHDAYYSGIKKLESEMRVRIKKELRDDIRRARRAKSKAREVPKKVSVKEVREESSPSLEGLVFEVIEEVTEEYTEEKKEWEHDQPPPAGGEW